MRLLERRYFTKLDDKKPGSTESISAFIKATHTEIMKHIQSLETTKQNLAEYVSKTSRSTSLLKISSKSIIIFKIYRTQCELSGALTTITHLIKLLDLPRNISDNLCSALKSTVIDYPEQVCICIR